MEPAANDPRAHDAGSASFGAWVRNRRVALDLTQSQLAERVSCAVITIRKIESDERRPSQLMAERIADALQIGEADRARFVAVARAFVSPVRLPPPGTGADEARPSAMRPTPAPAPVHRLIGRDAELADLLAMLSIGGGPARLVTITGPPGVGKTRLASEIGTRVGPTLDVPVVFVELAAAMDAEGFRERIGSALDVAGAMGVDRYELGRGALARVPTLLVLDNLEQVITAAAEQVASLLASCPDLCCLATSRTRLDIYGEHEFTLQPLALPPSGDTLPIEDVSRWPAVELFIDRARAARRGADLDTDTNGIVEICRRLDGLPLAIELAARRVRELEVDALAAKLGSGLGVLGTGSRDRDPRQRTMTGAVEWSYALLGKTAQLVLRATTVAAWSFTTDAAAAMAGVGVPDAQDAMNEIADHGLARRIGDRWALFEVVRAVAASRLDDHGEADVVRARHASHYVSVIEPMSSGCIGAETREQLDRIEAEYQELRAALEWTFDSGDAAVGRRLTDLLVSYWYPRCQWEEGSRWAERAYASSARPEDRARSAFTLALMSFGVDPPRAMTLLDESARANEVVGDADTSGHLIGFRGLMATMRGGHDEARELLEASEACFTESGNADGLALSAMRLGRLAFLSGDLDESERWWDDALARYTAIGSDFGAANVLSDLSELALARNDLDAAMRHAQDAVRLLWEFGADWYAASIITLVANVLAEADRPDDAARAYGMAEAWLADLGAEPIPVVAATYAEHRRCVEDVLGSDFDERRREGTLLPRTLDVVRSFASPTVPAAGSARA